MRPRRGPFQLNYFALLETMLLANGDRRLGRPVCSPGLDLKFCSRCGLVLLLFGGHFEVRLYAATISAVSGVALRRPPRPRIGGLLLRDERHKLSTSNIVVDVNARKYESVGSRLGRDGEGETQQILWLLG